MDNIEGVAVETNFSPKQVKLLKAKHGKQSKRNKYTVQGTGANSIQTRSQLSKTSSK